VNFLCITKLEGPDVELILLHKAVVRYRFSCSPDKDEPDKTEEAAALRVIRAYRTVLGEAALLLADPLASKRTRARVKTTITDPQLEGRPLTHSKIMVIEWKTTIRNRTGDGLILNIIRWEGRMVPKVPMTFHMTQALTGHVCFLQYLHRIPHCRAYSV